MGHRYGAEPADLLGIPKEMSWLRYQINLLCMDAGLEESKPSSPSLAMPNGVRAASGNGSGNGQAQKFAAWPPAPVRVVRDLSEILGREIE
jgi:hypothetical protein